MIIWGDDSGAMLDPKVPYQTYEPPPAPHYAQAAPPGPCCPTTAEACDGSGEPPADIFFVSPTTYDGGTRLERARSATEAPTAPSAEVMRPTTPGPSSGSGGSSPRATGQASLYTLLTLREDAREARRFAYADVADAFRYYRDRYNNGRPFILVGVEQGGTAGRAPAGRGDRALSGRCAASWRRPI